MAWAAVTKDHKLGGFEQQNSLSHSSGKWKTEIEVSAGLAPSEGHEGELAAGLSPGYWGLSVPRLVDGFPVSSHDLPIMCVYPCVQISPLIRTQSCWIRATLMTSS